ncbi:energy-coupling factor transporter transmembrane component T family protein [Shouchella lonarensis]|uniref:Energy-coupling factor transport system permease protein n=1 Tax=Shouchella lonarensis TaxID=1464122 RepID=A0A1G6M4T9_9BACI|nr:energy-coupling factor transporter transmembrane component T [Shouchella lonarensis]SDC50562.1 energy-coupling factor transport system permease protein [Shouchella lonarensis]
MKAHTMLLGRYIPGDSFVHTLDARVKLLSAFLFSLALFAINGALAFIVATIAVALGWHLSGVSWRILMKTFKLLGIFLFIFFMMQVVFVRTGEELVTIFSFPLYKEGVFGGLRVVWRTLLLFIAATLLTVTTLPLQLTSAFERLCMPLKKARVPVSELALVMSVAIRFLPTLAEELEKMVRAQTARGVVIRDQPLRRRVRTISFLLVPLMVRSLKRAEELAQAMEARGYVPGKHRTMWKKMKWTKRDTLTLLLSFVLIVVMISL